MEACMIVSVFLTLLFPVCGGFGLSWRGSPWHGAALEDDSEGMTQDRKGVAWRKTVAANRD